MLMSMSGAFIQGAQVERDLREAEKTREVRPAEVDPESWELFLELINKEDVDGVKAALAQGKNPNCSKVAGWGSPMWVTINCMSSCSDSQKERRLLSILDAFIEHGGNVNFRTGDNKSLLMWCIYYRYHSKEFGDAMQKLIKAGAFLSEEPLEGQHRYNFECFFEDNWEKDFKKRVLRLLVYYDVKFPELDGGGWPQQRTYIEQCKKHCEAIKRERTPKEALESSTYTGPVARLLNFGPVRQAIAGYAIADEDTELEMLRERMEVEQKPTEKAELKSS